MPLPKAMSYGLPALGFRNAEDVNIFVQDGFSGWLTDGLGDEEALAQVLAVACRMMTNLRATARSRPIKWRPTRLRSSLIGGRRYLKL